MVLAEFQHFTRHNLYVGYAKERGVTKRPKIVAVTWQGVVRVCLISVACAVTFVSCFMSHQAMQLSAKESA